jgi:ParB family chromosome partitioning protein
MEAIKEALPLGWLEERSEAGQYRRFIHLSDTEKLDILAYCVAVCLRPQLATGNGGTAYELALSLTEGNVAGYWRPTKESYLGRITRDQLLTLTKELMGVRWADARSRDKKGEIAATLERVFADPAKYAASPDQAAMIAKWLPEGMAFTALPTTETAAEQAA